MKIKELEFEQRPREKALRNGLDSLSDLELVALILQSGNRKRNAFEIANDVLKQTDNLKTIFDSNANTLMKIQGIHKAKSLQLLAGIELAKRSLRAQAYERTIRIPDDAANWFKIEFGTRKQENFVAVYLDTKGHIITHRVLFMGTLNTSSVHPREIFKYAFEVNAYSVLCLHNHPSGDPSPSNSDVEFTHRLEEISSLMGVPLVDHIIVGHNSWFSFRQEEYLH